MLNSEKIEKLFDDIKTPAMKLSAFKPDKDDLEPSTNSYFGGKPFITNKDSWPTCEHCKLNMKFLVQYRIISADKVPGLYCIYNCDCKLDTFEPSIYVFYYNDPKEDEIEMDLSNLVKPNKKLNILFDAYWSVPNWVLLPDISRPLYNEFLKHGESEKDSRDTYEEARDSLGFLTSRDSSFIGGYPEFVVSTKIMKCRCCSQETSFFFQLGDFNEVVLYCFLCPRTGALHFIYN